MIASSAVWCSVAVGADSTFVATPGATGNCGLFGAGSNGFGPLGIGGIQEGRIGRTTLSPSRLERLLATGPPNAAQSTPVRFTLPAGVTIAGVSPAISASVLGGDGNVYTAGHNNYGQLGNALAATPFDGTPRVFALPAGETAARVITDDALSIERFALTASGKVFGAGANQQGQLGNTAAGTTDQTTAVQFELPAGERAVDVSATHAWTSVLTASGKVYGAGQNGRGTLGNTASGFTDQTTPVRFDLPVGEMGAKVFTSYGEMTYVLTTSGKVYGAGANGNGQLGNTATAGVDQFTPVRFDLPVGERAIDVITPYFGSVLVLTESGKVYGAGGNDSGNLGNTASGTTNQTTPVRFDLPAGEVATRVLSGYISTYVLTASGKVYGAGANASGQLGNTAAGMVDNQATPVRFDLPAGEVAVDVQTSPYSTAPGVSVLTASGKVYSAGANGSGRFGNTASGTTDQSTPVGFELPAGEVAAEVIMHAHDVLVRTASGRVFGAGDNLNGELGNGTTAQTTTPVEFQLPSGHRARYLAATRGYQAESRGYNMPFTFVVGCQALLSLGDSVFADANDNGVRDSGEAGLAGVVVRLYKQGETSPFRAMATNSNGSYLFTDLPEGIYIIEIDAPTGYRSSTDGVSAGSPSGTVDGDDNGVGIGATTIRSAPIQVRLGSAALGEGTTPGITDTNFDFDSHKTIDFGLYKIPPAAVVAPAVKTPDEVTPTPFTVQAETRTRLAAKKSADHTRVYGGQSVTFQITVKNTGKHAAKNVQVCDELPRELSLTGQVTNGRIRHQHGLVCATLANIAAGASRTVTISTRVASNTQRGTIRNRASIAATNAASIRASATITILGPASAVAPAVTG